MRHLTGVGLSNTKVKQHHLGALELEDNYNSDIKELQVSDPHMQLFRTVSGEKVKPIGRYEINVRLARRHPFTHKYFCHCRLRRRMYTRI
jgi:hypothetical protein